MNLAQCLPSEYLARLAPSLLLSMWIFLLLWHLRGMRQKKADTFAPFVHFFFYMCSLWFWHILHPTPNPDPCLTAGLVEECQYLAAALSCTRPPLGVATCSASRINAPLGGAMIKPNAAAYNIQQFIIHYHYGNPSGAAHHYNPQDGTPTRTDFTPVVNSVIYIPIS